MYAWSGALAVGCASVHRGTPWVVARRTGLENFVASGHTAFLNAAPNEGDGMLFGFGSNQDYADATRVIAFADAGGLGLPDRDYYVKTDAKSQETRQRYVEHVAKILRLLGEAEAAAKKDADTVMRIETGLARASLTRVDRRDPYKIYHRMYRAEMQALTPSFRWDGYLRAIGQPALDDVNVTEPEFYKQVEKTLAGESLDDLKTYLRWQLAHNRARYLSSPFVNESACVTA